MKKIGYSLLAICVFTLSLHAQESAEKEVENTIRIFFQGMYDNDSTKIKAVTLPTTQLHSVVSPSETKNTQVKEADFQGFIKNIGTKKPGLQLDERIHSYTIKIDGEMASAWTPYSFYVNNSFSHCGVNVFLLVRMKEGWKIQFIMDTRRKENCVTE